MEFYYIVLTIIFLLVLHFISKYGKKPEVNYDYLLVGNSNSGKTSLIYKLKNLTNILTINSLNITNYFIKNPINETELSFVDIPGLEKFNFEITKYLSISKNIILIIDATNMFFN